MHNLYKYDSKGKIRVWSAETTQKDATTGHITITITHGQLDGKLQTKTRVVKSGKNKGKANETTVDQQAELELKSLYQKQYDDGYVDDIANYEEPRSPVLAHKYKDKSHLIKYGVKNYYGSTKLNGIRCFIFVINGIPTRFESRTRKAFKFFKHISEDMIANGITTFSIYDGELFNPLIPFEIICSLVNSDEYVSVTDPETGLTWTTDDIEFHCYDTISLEDLDASYEDRFVNMLHTSTNTFKFVENVLIEDEETLVTVAKDWISKGHEGLMLRDGSAAYEFGKRSASLLKYKIMEQAEFEIVDVTLAPNDDMKVQATLKCDAGTFDVGTIKGNKEDNYRLYYLNRDEIIGKFMTVDYQTLSSYGIPLFPVGIGIREGTVIDGKFVPEV